MKKKLLYEVVMSVLAIIAVILAIYDILHGLSPIQNYLDIGILTIFIIDYFIRLLFSKDKKEYIKSNILDLIAIIPFNSIFRAFRIFRLFKLVRFTKITKLGRLAVYSSRMIKKTNKFFNTNGFKYILLLVLLIILIGATGISYFENMSFSDSLWWAFVTATTVGYGDLSPSTSIGRCIAVILMVSGIGLLGTLTSTITNYFLNFQKNTVTDEIIEKIKLQISDIDNLSDDDIDDICKVLKSLNKN